MSEPRTGSRYEIQIARKGKDESKAAHDYFAVHTGDVEEVKDEGEDDLVGYVHSYEVGSTVDGPGLRFVGFLSGCLLRCQVLPQPGYLAQVQRPPGDRLARDAADRQVRARAQDQQGGHHALRRRADAAAAVRDPHLSSAARRSGCTRAWTPPAAWATR